MRVLVSTFGPGDTDKVIQAMRALPYDRLVLVGASGTEESKGFERLRSLEEMSGHVTEVEVVDEDQFLVLVDRISEILSKHASGDRGKNTVRLNISGGSKLLGDAALLAAFRLGIETYHCEGKLVRLPILSGATAADRFTGPQIRMITRIGESAMTLDELIAALEPSSKQATERVIRELRRQGLLRSEARSGKVIVSLSDTGREVLRAIRSSASMKGL